MTRKDGILIASRTLAVFLGVSALLGALILPVEILNTIHTGSTRSFANNYFVSLSQITLALSIIRILAQVALARVLWTCNSFVERILGGADGGEDIQPNPQGQPPASE